MFISAPCHVMCTGPDSGYLQYIHVLGAPGVVVYVVYIKETVNYAILTSD